MRDRELESISHSRPRLSERVANRQAGKSPLASQRDPLARVLSSPVGTPSIETHASALNRTTGSRSFRPGRSLLQLQQRYGNRYVQRVLDISKSADKSRVVIQRTCEDDERMSNGGACIQKMVSSPVIQRWRRGVTGEEPIAGAYEPVPPEQVAMVNAARNIIDRVRSNRRCRNYFRDHCSDGSGPNAIDNAFNNVIVWFSDVTDRLGRSVNGTHHVAYSRSAARIGVWTVAGSILHEMFHTCDPVLDPTDEPRAEDALDACRIYAPFIRNVPRSAAAGSTITIRGFGFGPRQGSADRVEFGGNTATVISWRRNRIEVQVPVGASGPIVVYNNNVASNAIPFTLTP